MSLHSSAFEVKRPFYFTFVFRILAPVLNIIWLLIFIFGTQRPYTFLIVYTDVSSYHDILSYIMHIKCLLTFRTYAIAYL